MSTRNLVSAQVKRTYTDMKSSTISGCDSLTKAAVNVIHSLYLHILKSQQTIHFQLYKLSLRISSTYRKSILKNKNSGELNTDSGINNEQIRETHYIFITARLHGEFYYQTL